MTTVTYSADGLTMVGHLALPAGVGRRPAVLIGPDVVSASVTDRSEGGRVFDA